MSHLRDYCDGSASVPSRHRGDAHQHIERTLEQAVRFDAATLSRDLRRQGYTGFETANLLDVAPRTLRSWAHDLGRGPRRPCSLGRPVLHSSREQRNEVIHLLDEYGPAMGMPTLRQVFPAMLRAELQDLLTRYRRVWRARHYEPLRVLHWSLPGRVWALDFTGPIPLLVTGERYLLAVRDLATGRQLLWQPCPEATAAVTADALAALFRMHGAPLVLKADNGAPFVAESVRTLANDLGVKMLFSPPGVPRYNGAIEAGIGSLKTRTNQQATRQGHRSIWTLDDLAAAQAEANATARPGGDNGPTPDQAWANRPAISAVERTLFREQVERQRMAIDVQGGPYANPTTDASERARDREAIRRALEGLGLLTYTRRRIPLPIRKKKVAIIT